MQKKKICIWMLFLMTLLLPAAVSAEERKDEWKQPGYVFDSLKILLLDIEFGDRVQADDLKRCILTDKVESAFVANTDFAQAGLSFMRKDELVKRLGTTSGEDVAALAKSEPARYQQLLKEGAAFYCQGVLQVRYSSYYDSVRRVPTEVVNYETTKDVHINKNVTASNGTQVTVDEWVSVPVTESRVVPEHDEITSHVSVELTLFDAKSQQAVWKMVDSRDAVSKEKDGMAERILKRAAERLLAVKKS